MQNDLRFQFKIFSFLILGLILFTVPAPASERCESVFSGQKLQYRIAQTELEASVGTHSPAPGVLPDGLPGQFRVLSWNVHKMADPHFKEDLDSFLSEADLALLQEGIEDPSFFTLQTISDRPMSWSFARSWYSRKAQGATGVTTGSRAIPLRARGYKSPVTEPMVGTPKTILISEFRIAGRRETLLVANMHAINFVLQDRFEQHVDQLVRLLEGHSGPIIVAGDFNTWSPGRMRSLRSRLDKIGLHHVDEATAWLDHFFVRDLEVTSPVPLKVVSSSDHQPLMIEVRVLP